MDSERIHDIMRRPEFTRESRARGGFYSCVDCFRNRDVFAEGYQMKLDAGKSVLTTLGGAFCSLLLFISIMAFTMQKADVLLNRNDTDILSTMLDLHFSDEDVFGYENGLNLAVAFTAYDNEREWILDPSYGELVFNHFSWGPNPDGSYFTNRERLESQVCTR